jgi:RNA-directed DNA polymerase
MTHLSYKLKDKELLRLISKYLRAGIMNNNHFEESREGVPQGGPLSPLLANIMLDPLDKELEKRGHKFARYADEFTIFVKSKRAGERILHSISNYLERRLKLIVNSDKSRVVKISESKFLGRFIYKSFRSGIIQIHPKTLYRFKEQVRRLTNRNGGVSMRYQLFKTSQYLLGWINYFPLV